MAWKRGTQKNQAGEIRKGQIREFLQPTSKQSSVSCRLKIIDKNAVSNVDSLLDTSSFAFINFEDLPEYLNEFIITDVTPNVLYLHAHEHPTAVITCVSNDFIAQNCIALSDAHRINSKVCIGENEEWTVYRGEQFTYDAREVSIGDTTVRSTHQCPHLDSIIFDIRLKSIPSVSCSNEKSAHIAINTHILRPKLLKYFCQNILTVEELFSYNYNSTEDTTNALILSVAEVTAIPSFSTDITDIENVDESHEGEEFTIDTAYRGLVTEDTKVYIRIDEKCTQVLQLINNVIPPPPVPLKHVVYILTSDNECFPVKRRLLRPCLALTALVQSGRGKYSTLSRTNVVIVDDTLTPSSIASSTSIINVSVDAKSTFEEISDGCVFGTVTNPYKIDVDACTFDRVLLYLEHEARHEPFRFEPLIVSELRDAAVKLKIMGLLDTCDKVLGSFQERVRKTPIRLSEVIARNQAGTNSATTTTTTTASDGTVITVITITGKRSETLLLLSGMVLDVSRWLEEHPGGSSIIPAQALNIDSSVFFEIYHASKQSYLYLKEFYIGELAQEDLELVQSPHSFSSSSSLNSSNNENGNLMNGKVRKQPVKKNENASAASPSAAFMEQLAKVTSWRLKPENMDNSYRDMIHKSF